MCYSLMISHELEDLGREFNAEIDQSMWDSLRQKATIFPKKIKFPDEVNRIFPNYFAPVIHKVNGSLTIEPMRYSVFSPFPYQDSQLQPFNARRDKLDGTFWSNLYRNNHGFVVAKGFFEWVLVSDLLEAGQVSLSEIEAEFDRQRQERREKILSQNKKYKPTPTESMDPRERRIVVQFYRDDNNPMIIPAIYNQGSTNEIGTHFGFAVITDEPHPDVLAAGHDRTPMILNRSALSTWLESPYDINNNDHILSSKVDGFRHRIPDPA